VSDFASAFSLKLPGFSIGVIKYINDKSHKLRWVLKNRKTGEVYFVVIFTLLFGDDLEEEMKLERERWVVARKKAGVAEDERVDSPGPGQSNSTTAPDEKVQRAYADLSVG
jgi:hypothetical protein